MKKYFAGIDLGGTKFATILADEKGRVIAKKKNETRAYEGSERVIGRMIDSIREILAENGAQLEELAAIGLGIPGQQDSKKGICISAHNLGWVNLQVLEPFRNAFGVPVSMDNDVRVATLGELKYGAGRGFSNFICMTIGTGIGSGIVLNGSLYSGPVGLAGELGHMIVVPDGDPCLCGSNGCLEAYASSYGMVRLAKKHISSGRKSIMVDMVEGNLEKITPKVIEEAYDCGDRVASEIMEGMFKYISIAICNCINLFNFERVIIGGGVSNMGDKLLNRIREYVVHPRIPKPSQEILSIVRAELGEEAGMFGALALARKSLEEKGA